MGLPPRINDISTDLDDPPAILGRPPLPERFKSEIRRGYPDLAPLQLARPAPEVFQAALEVAHAQPRWILQAVDREGLQFHAVAITRLFRFRDDLTVRVRARGDGCRVDMRSKSRLGISDLGANAGRIRAFLTALDQRVAAPE